SILPGSTYIMPPSQGKLNPLHMDGDLFVRKIDFNAGKIDQQIVQTYMGISPLLANEIVTLANLGDQQAYKHAFLTFLQLALKHEYEPFIVNEGKEGFYIFPLTTKPAEKEYFSSISNMLDTFYSGKAERDRVKQKAGDLLRFLTNERKKNKRKLIKLDQTLEEAKQADRYQKH